MITEEVETLRESVVSASACPARCRLHELAGAVHLSPSQIGRVFVDAYGKTSMTYLTTLRAEHPAHLLRETDVPIEEAMREVGWHSRGHAARCSAKAWASRLPVPAAQPRTSVCGRVIAPAPARAEMTYWRTRPSDSAGAHLISMTVSMRVMSAGDGYKYLLRKAADQLQVDRFRWCTGRVLPAGTPACFCLA